MTAPQDSLSHQVSLVPLNRGDADEVSRGLLRADDLWQLTTHHETPWGQREVNDYLDRAEHEHATRQAWRFGIRVSDRRLAAPPELVGVAEMYRVSWIHRSAYVGMTIWQPANRHRGYGKAAVAELVELAFGRLDLAKLSATVISGNRPSERLFEAAGFIPEGTLRDQVFIAGSRRDLLIYGLLGGSDG